MYHMTHVIINLIVNSIDALNKYNTDNAYIEITIDTSNDWIYSVYQR